MFSKTNSVTKVEVNNNFKKVSEEKTANDKSVGSLGNLPKLYCRGGFSPEDPLLYGEYQIFIGLATVENVFTDYTKPEYTQPRATIRLYDPKENDYFDYDCPNPIITKEKIILRSIDTPIGIVSIEGRLVDKKGQPWDKMYVKNKETFLEGKLTIEQKNEVKFSKEYTFYFTDGMED